MTADALGGVWTYALELARGLGEFGVEVRLAVMGGGITPGRLTEVADLRDVSLAATDLKLEWMQEPWNDVDRAGDWLLEQAEEFRPDIVHLNGYVHAPLSWKKPVLVVAHSCVVSWFRAVRGEDAPQDWNVYRERVRDGLGAADYVVAPSQAMLASVVRDYGPLRRTGVVWNGRRPGAFHTGPKQNLILSAGRLWDDAKNLRTLAAVADRVEWPLFVAGDASHPEGGEREFPRVRMLGNLGQSELAAWYARAAIYALPALYEPFGYTALEAALSGCVLALSDILSLREIWEGAACFIDPHDPEAWIYELNRLSQDARKRSALAHAGKQRALELSPAAMTRGYLNAYDAARRNQTTCASFSSAIPFDPTGTTETRTSSAA
jgi:glycosyltransferase involved in cell wall biosynthesis